MTTAFLDNCVIYVMANYQNAFRCMFVDGFPLQQERPEYTSMQPAWETKPTNWDQPEGEDL